MAHLERKFILHDDYHDHQGKSSAVKSVRNSSVKSEKGNKKKLNLVLKLLGKYCMVYFEVSHFKRSQRI